MYKLLLFAHVLSAIVSIGPFFALFPMIKRLKRAASIEETALMNIFKSVIRLIKHAGHALVITGALLVYSAGWSWSEPWILMTLVIMFGSIFFLASAFTPIIDKYFDEKGDKDKLITQLNRTLWIYISLLMALLWLMVAKPRLW